MNRFLISTMLLFAMVPSISKFDASEVSNLSNSESDERSWTTVNPGRTVNMKRDHKYATTPYSTNGSWVQNITRNHENESVADGYTGYADILIETSSGTNILKLNNYKLKAGEHKTATVYDVNPNRQYVSSVDWEIIDGQDSSGSKVIWASVE